MIESVLKFAGMTVTPLATVMSLSTLGCEFRKVSQHSQNNFPAFFSVRHSQGNKD